MRSLLEKKPWVLLFSLAALGALVVLSVSLGKVSFGEAQPIGWEEAEPLARPRLQGLGEIREELLQSQAILIIAFVVLVGLISVLLSPEGRKRMFLLLFRMGVTILALYFLFNRYPGMFDFLETGPAGEAPYSPSIETGASVPPPVFTPPQETPILSYAVSLLVVLGVIFVAWKAYQAWQAMNRRPVKSLQELARIARSSLRDLSDGQATSDVIMRCYFRMGDVVADKRNLQRGAGMTPAEFAARLEAAGLPGDAVRRLTRLFESVRYGDRKAGPKDVNEAVACLTSILQYCEEPV
jgi:hypothetical protein